MTITYVFLALMVAVAIIFDIIIVLWKGINATISARVWDLAHKYPIIPLAVGILMGHLFWSQC